MSGADGSQGWVEAGFDALAQGGVDRVRVEVLAERLGVTKGGFYRRFRDRPALLAAMLETWAEGRIAAIRQQTELDGATPRERLRSLIRLFSERLNAQGLSSSWRSGGGPAATPRPQRSRVGAMRLEAVASLYAQLGYGPQEARPRAGDLRLHLPGRACLLPEASAGENATRDGRLRRCSRGRLGRQHRG